MKLVNLSEVINEIEKFKGYLDEDMIWRIKFAINRLPATDAESVQPVEFEWCHDCKEYDQNAHCCHRWTKVIRNTVNDLKTQGYEPVRHGRWIHTGFMEVECSNCGNVFHELEDTNYCPHCGAKMIPTIPKEIIDAVLGEDEVEE